VPLRLRPALAACLVLAVTGTGVASAAPRRPAVKPVCTIVTDVKGDGSVAATPNSKALDIVSADIATGPKTVTGVIRVDGMGSDPATTLGVEYKINFTVGDVSQYLRYQNSTGLGETYDYGDQSGTNGGSTSKGAASGSINPATGEITFTAPKSDFPGLKGGTATAIVARSYVSAGAVFEPADTATGTTPYKDLTPSCVAAK
jgi:hypothetical protein